MSRPGVINDRLYYMSRHVGLLRVVSIISEFLTFAAGCNRSRDAALLEL